MNEAIPLAILTTDLMVFCYKPLSLQKKDNIQSYRHQYFIELPPSTLMAITTTPRKS